MDMRQVKRYSMAAAKLLPLWRGGDAGGSQGDGQAGTWRMIGEEMASEDGISSKQRLKNEGRPFKFH